MEIATPSATLYHRLDRGGLPSLAGRWWIMAASKLYFVQHFEKQGSRLGAGQILHFKTADEAQRRADRDGERLGVVVGVVAIEQTVDVDTGEILEAPIVLARHGRVPDEVAGDLD